MNTSQFRKDFRVANELYPRLNSVWSAEHKMWIIRGDLDICDSEGVFWDTFNLAILVPKGYPYIIPVVVEVSKLIPRDIDWHISSEGVCCVDEHHSLLAWSKRGIRIDSFLKDKVYPFFANQLYKLHSGNYAGKEYKHFAAGVLQYYIEELKINTRDLALNLIQMVLQGKIVRNEQCPCGSGRKVKICHEASFAEMRAFGPERLRKDLEEIRSCN